MITIELLAFMSANSHLDENKCIVARNLVQLSWFLLFLRLLKTFHLNFFRQNKVLSLSREKLLWEEKEIARTCHIQKCYAMPPTEKII